MKKFLILMTFAMCAQIFAGQESNNLPWAHVRNHDGTRWIVGPLYGIDTPLFEAAWSGDYEKAVEALSRGARVHTLHLETAVQNCCKEKMIDYYNVVNLLLDHGACAGYRTQILKANGQGNIAKILNSLFNRKDGPAYYDAAAYNRRKAVWQQLNQKIKLEQKSVIQKRLGEIQHALIETIEAVPILLSLGGFFLAANGISAEYLLRNYINRVISGRRAEVQTSLLNDINAQGDVQYQREGIYKLKKAGLLIGIMGIGLSVLQWLDRQPLNAIELN